MKSTRRKLVVAALLVLSAGAASAGVSVKFVDTDKYADLPQFHGDRDAIMKELARHFSDLGKTLAAGHKLTIEVLDVDLAGRVEPTRRAEDLRILRGGADWPSMRLRYTLDDNGKVVSSGEASLSDMNYLHNMNRYGGSDALRYEKKMIDDWFRRQFEPAAVASH